MGKNTPARKRKRVVSVTSPDLPATPPAAPSAPAPDAVASPTRQTRSAAEPPVTSPKKMNSRGIAFGVVVAFAVIAVLLVAGGELGGSTATTSRQTPLPAATTADAAFAGIDRTDVTALMQRGKQLYDQANYADAARVYQEAVRLKPDNQAAQSNLGSAFFQLKQLDDALKAFREAVRLSPSDADAHQNLGAGLAAQGDFDGAIAEYLQAISLKDDLAPAHYSLGVLYQEKGNKDEAIQELKRYLQLGAEDQLRSDAQSRLQTLGAQ